MISTALMTQHTLERFKALNAISDIESTSVDYSPYYLFKILIMILLHCLNLKYCPSEKREQGKHFF